MTQLSAPADTAPASTTGLDAETPMAKQAVELGHETCEIELTAGKVSLAHDSWVAEIAPASTTGAEAAVATTKQAAAFTHLSCDNVLYFGPVAFGMSCTQVSADPEAAPPSRTAPVAVLPVTKHAVVPAQVMPESDVRVTPAGGESFDQVSLTTLPVFDAFAPRMTGPVAVVPMARQAVELGHRT